MTDHNLPAAVLDAEKNALKPKKARLGLAFSGGGIRSACFNLGMLQAVDKRDLLGSVDYVSTVSGGGYIGSWLLSCLKRNPLFRPNEAWPQIGYTRGYARYLAPRSGAFSADTWTILMIWLRNTALLQATLASFLGAVLLLPRIWKVAFDALGLQSATVWIGFALAAFGLGAALLEANGVANGRQGRGTSYVQGVIVAPLILAGGLLAAVVWQTDYPSFFGYASAGVGSVATLAVLACVKGKGKFAAPLVGAVSGAVFYPLIWGLERIQWVWDEIGRTANDAGDWYAALFLEPLYLLVLFAVVILLMGLCGKLMEDSVREWWSRLGALIGINTLGLAALGFASAFGPVVVLWLVETAGKYITAGGFSVGAAITALGALTGTSANGGKGGVLKKAALAAAPALFVGILILAISTGLHALLASLASEETAALTTSNYWATLAKAHGGAFWGSALPGVFAALTAVTAILSWRVDLNEFSMNHFYRNRLVRCFMGAARLDIRTPNRFTGFDMADNYPVTSLKGPDYKGPIPIVNTAVNLTGGGDAVAEQRRASNFFFTPYYCGSTETGFAEMDQFPGPRTLTLGAAVATSGAAASPNMGYHTSTPIAFLLTFFNVRLGWWVPNPRFHQKGRYHTFLGLSCLLQELFGSADIDDKYLYLSDGGHFENLAVYELVRRRCKYIVAGDGEADGDYVFNGLGSLIRKCRTDFGVDIDIDIMPIKTKKDGERYNEAQFAIGTIHYGGGEEGTLVYVKSSLSGTEPTDIMQYAFETPAFPHESTADQFFDESQFESYRKLGKFIGGLALDARRNNRSIADEIRAAVALTAGA